MSVRRSLRSNFLPLGATTSSLQPSSVILPASLKVPMLVAVIAGIRSMMDVVAGARR